MNPLPEIAIIGAGTMGSGIAQVAAVHGCLVHLIDVSPDFVQRGLENIRKNFDRLVERGQMSPAERTAVFDRIRPQTSFDQLHPVQLVIEAIIEDLPAKQKAFAQIQSAAPAAVLATNTSSLSIDRIADALIDPSRLVGMHFFNPAPLMPLVEIIAGRRSSTATLDFAANAARAWGKVVVRVKDTPGFIVNRVARGYYLEALRLFGEGVAGISEIDLLMRAGGFKMGPFQLMDLVGLDVNLAVSTSVWEQMNRHPRFEPHEIQKKLVAAGRLGRKTGRGFYDYEQGPLLPALPIHRKSFSLSPLLVDAIRAFATRALESGKRPPPPLGTTEQYVFARILAAVINEAGLALQEGVATREDIDLAMVKGTNYPKGPLDWAHQIGFRTVRGLLKHLSHEVDPRRWTPSQVFSSED